MAKRRRPTSNASRGACRWPAAMIDAPSRRVQAAHGLWNQGRRGDALALFAEAIRQEPNNVRTYVMAARAYAEKYDFARMEDVHEKLVRRAPRHPGVHHYIGETFVAAQAARSGRWPAFARRRICPAAGRRRGWSWRRCTSGPTGSTRPRS